MRLARQTVAVLVPEARPARAAFVAAGLGPGPDALRCSLRRCLRSPLTNLDLVLPPSKVLEVADAIAEPYRALVLTAAYTCCRFGELAGLRVHRLDLLRGTQTIAEALSDVRGKMRLLPPKAAAARRQVALPRFLADELESHLGRWPAAADAFVYTAPEGGPLRRTYSADEIGSRRYGPQSLSPSGFTTFVTSTRPC